MWVTFSVLNALMPNSFILGRALLHLRIEFEQNSHFQDIFVCSEENDVLYINTLVECKWTNYFCVFYPWWTLLKRFVFQIKCKIWSGNQTIQRNLLCFLKLTFLYTFWRKVWNSSAVECNCMCNKCNCLHQSLETLKSFFMFWTVFISFSFVLVALCFNL